VDAQEECTVVEQDMEALIMVEECMVVELVQVQPAVALQLDAGTLAVEHVTRKKPASPM